MQPLYADIKFVDTWAGPYYIQQEGFTTNLMDGVTAVSDTCMRGLRLAGAT